MQRAAAFPVASLLAALALIVGSSDALAAKQVTISGKAYSFNHADTPIAGATIRVREMPKRSATTEANGDYRLKVPDDATVTPYIDPPAGFNEIDLQTLHTRGEDIENANFQTPADFEYFGLAAILGVELGPDDRPTECVVVTTVSARNVRGVPFETFVERTPHGVAGARASEIPALPGPTYFNDAVIPDPSKTESSGDGGIVWTGVPAGTYRFVAEHPDTGFAPFLATCAPGRVVNANPPWGMYELARGEEPLGASVVAARARGPEAVRRGGGRTVRASIEAAESIHARAVVRARGRRVSRREDLRFGPGARRLRLEVRKRAPRGRALLRLRLEDATGERVIVKRRLRLPGTGRS